MLCMSTVFLSYLCNHWHFLISVSGFWAYLKQESTNESQIYSVVRIEITNFESRSFEWIFIREFLKKATVCAHETYTFIIYFCFMLWTVRFGDCRERFVTTALNSIALRHRVCILREICILVFADVLKRLLLDLTRPNAGPTLYPPGHPGAWFWRVKGAHARA